MTTQTDILMKIQIEKSILNEFDRVRKNALANPNLMNGLYAQKNRKEALIQFLLDNCVRLRANHNKLCNELIAYKDKYGDLKQ